MKVLLMSVKAGYGHHSTAKAIMDMLSERGAESEMLDVFESVSPILRDAIQDGYIFTTKHLARAYGSIYDRLSKKDDPYGKRSLASLTSELISGHISKYVNEYQPDLIIGTHSYAAYVMTLMRKSGDISCPLFGIVTDYMVHPFWESTELDYYVVQDELMNYLMMKKGIPITKLLPIGIPVRKEFSYNMNKQLARRGLNIADKQTALIMMGSMGFGNMKELVEIIDEYPSDFQILCVCGNNTKMYNALNKRAWKKDVIIYGFVDNVDMMMDASDFIVTKPGGLTTAETLSKGLPMIIVNPIPGQETKNLAFLTNSGAAIAVNKNFGMGEALNFMFGAPWRIELMRESISRIAKPNATRDLCDKIFQCLNKNEGVTVNS